MTLRTCYFLLVPVNRTAKHEKKTHSENHEEEIYEKKFFTLLYDYIARAWGLRINQILIGKSIDVRENVV